MKARLAHSRRRQRSGGRTQTATTLTFASWRTEDDGPGGRSVAALHRACCESDNANDPKVILVRSGEYVFESAH